MKNHFLDSCSNDMHDLKHRRKIIDEYKKQINILNDFIKLEDQSLKRLEKNDDWFFHCWLVLFTKGASVDKKRAGLPSPNPFFFL